MKLKKGSAEAKRFMASIRAKKKGPKKVSAKKKAPAKKLSGTKKTGYYISTGHDHYRNKPLYKVVNNSTDYIGEWHTSKKMAQAELNYITKGGKKLAGPKKALAKKTKPSGSHKDSKSHNVKISVVSGLQFFDFDVYKNYMYDIMKDSKGKRIYIVYDSNVKKELFETKSLSAVKKFIDKLIKIQYLNDKRKYQNDQLRNPKKYKL